MKDYINKTLYDMSGLVIGMNDKGTSMIFGQNDEWIVLDEKEVKSVVDCLAKDQMQGLFDGFNYSMRENGLLLNQQGHSVYISKEVYAKLCNK